jgi:hypothetical protein
MNSKRFRRLLCFSLSALCQTSPFPSLRGDFDYWLRLLTQIMNPKMEKEEQDKNCPPPPPHSGKKYEGKMQAVDV